MGLLDGAVGSLIGAGASIGGSLLEHNWAKDAANAAMDFSREMSNTSYQRAVADMKAAGLNPMLAYGQGGASTPQGVAASVPAVGAGAVSSALSARRLKADIENIDQSIKESKANQELKSNEADYYSNLAAGAEMDNRLKAMQVFSAKNTYDWEKSWPRLSGFNRWISPILGNLFGSARDIALTGGAANIALQPRGRESMRKITGFKR